MEKTTAELDRILTKEFLQENYIDKKIAYYKIAKIIGCDSSGVKKRLVKFGIPIRGTGETREGKKLPKEHLEHLRESWKKRPKYTKEIKNKMSLNRKGKPKPKGFGEKLSKILKGKPHNFKNKEEHLRNRLLAICKSPNKFEIKCMGYLNKLYPGKFVYTGNGDCIIGGRSADAFSEELDTVVLFNGCYWHLDRNNLKRTEENKLLREQIESKPFLKNIYNVWFIWEDKLEEITKVYCRFTNKNTWV